MPHAFILDFAGSTSDDYDWVVERMGLDGRLPDGALAHAAMPSGTGWRICDVWETPDAFGRFAQERIGPLTDERGMAQPQITSFDAHHWERVSDDRATFVQVVRLPGIDLAAFDEADSRIRPDGRFPEGVIWHVNGALDGGVCVIDAWTDRGLRDRFLEENIRPAMQDAPLGGPPQFSEHEVHATLE